jgi:hypothetical protein
MLALAANSSDSSVNPFARQYTRVATTIPSVVPTLLEAVPLAGSMPKVHLSTAADCTLPAFDTSLYTGACLTLPGGILANGTSCSASCIQGRSYQSPSSYAPTFTCINAALTTTSTCKPCSPPCASGQYQQLSCQGTQMLPGASVYSSTGPFLAP